MSASLTLFEKEHAAKEKYIYFICGVAGALVAYIGKDYKPNQPWTTHDTLTIWTLSCLTLSFGSGLGRILTYNHGLSLNKDFIVAAEGVKNIVDSLAHHKSQEGKGAVPFTLGDTGEVSKESLESQRDALRLEKSKIFPKMKRWFEVSTGIFVVCHLFLVAGFVLLILSKIFQ